LRSLGAAQSFVSAAIGSMQVDQKRRFPVEDPFDRRGFSAIADRSTEADRTLDLACEARRVVRRGRTA